MCTSSSRQRGQALVEALAACLVLVPLALLVVLLGKYQTLNTAAIAASRTLAFECTVRPQDCVQPSMRAALANDLRRRHFGRIDREILTDDVLDDSSPAGEHNALWVDRRGRRLLERMLDVDVALSSPHFEAGRSTALGHAASAAVEALDRLAGPARFGLAIEGGMARAGVQVRVSPSEAGNERLARLDSMPLTIRASTAVLTDAWSASGPFEADDHSVRARVRAGSRLDALHEAEFVAGYQLTRWALDLMDIAGLEPRASSFRPHDPDVDRVPADRVGP